MRSICAHVGSQKQGVHVPRDKESTHRGMRPPLTARKATPRSMPGGKGVCRKTNRRLGTGAAVQYEVSTTFPSPSIASSLSHCGLRVPIGSRLYFLLIRLRSRQYPIRNSSLLHPFREADNGTTPSKIQSSDRFRGKHLAPLAHAIPIRVPAEPKVYPNQASLILRGTPSCLFLRSASVHACPEAIHNGSLTPWDVERQV